MDLSKNQKETLRMVRSNYREILVSLNICPKCQTQQLEKSLKLCKNCRLVNMKRMKDLRTKGGHKA